MLNNTAVKITLEQSSAAGEGGESGACDRNRIQSDAIIIAPTQTKLTALMPLNVITGEYDKKNERGGGGNNQLFCLKITADYKTRVRLESQSQ